MKSDSDYIKIISDAVEKACVERGSKLQSRQTAAVIEVFSKILLGVSDVMQEMEDRLDRVEAAAAVPSLAKLREAGIDVEKLFGDAKATKKDGN